MSTHRLHTLHERLFEQNRFVYPVLSRRAEGLSVGVNLNPDKVCNFGCIYCQVDRTSESETRFVETDAMLDELRGVLRLAASGEIFQLPKFADTPDSSAAAERYRLQRRRRADHAPQLRRDHRALGRGEAGAGASRG